jgi:hypothetical protein
VEVLPNRQAATLVNWLKRVKPVYRQRGFQVNKTYMDGEFESIRGVKPELGTGLNEAARDERYRYYRRIHYHSIQSTMTSYKLSTFFYTFYISFR